MSPNAKTSTNCRINRFISPPTGLAADIPRVRTQSREEPRNQASTSARNRVTIRKRHRPTVGYLLLFRRHEPVASTRLGDDQRRTIRFFELRPEPSDVDPHVLA